MRIAVAASSIRSGYSTLHLKKHCGKDVIHDKNEIIRMVLDQKLSRAVTYGLFRGS